MNTNQQKTKKTNSSKTLTPTQKKQKTVKRAVFFLTSISIVGLCLIFFLSGKKAVSTSAIEDFSSFLSFQLPQDSNPSEILPKNTETTKTLDEHTFTTSTNSITTPQTQKKQPASSEKTNTPNNQQAKDTSQVNSTKITDKKTTDSKKQQTDRQVPTTKQTENKKTQTSSQVSANKTSSTENTQTSSNKQVSISTNKSRFPNAVAGAKLVFVIDDAGHNIRELTPFTKLPFNVAIAVLPKLRYSKEVADLIRQAKKEVLLHQPMQAKNLSVSPGEGAILPQMNYSEITELLIDNVSEISPVIGINNHEGSLISENASQIGAVLDFCKEHNLFYLDSRTTAQTKATEEAKKRNIKVLERSVFLDNEKDTESILKQIIEGAKVANKQGSAIMIGHVWCENLADVLLDVYPELVFSGYEISTLTEFLIGDD